MKKSTRISLLIASAIVVTLAVSCVCFLNIALYNDTTFDEDYQYARLCEKYPHITQWVDSIRPLMRDTIITNASGNRLFARYASASNTSNKTAIIIHGYKSNSIAMMHIGYMFHHDFGYNILLPDLHSHGKSDGRYIQMGWRDKDDVRRWIDVAIDIFGNNTDIVITGISMGGATTMMTSDEKLPSNVKCFVEDCGYTSVWDEFQNELAASYHLPAFPLLYLTSALNKVVNGWSFGEASSLNQVRNCRLPMMFIHGENDTYVPTPMVYTLYDEKREPKELYISPGSVHAMSYHDNPQEYSRRVGKFVTQYCR